MKQKLIDRAFNEVSNTELLQKIMECSYDHLGFFTERYPRVFEYTWILEKMEGVEGNLLDIGAGASPVPILLSETNKVTTVDYMEDKGNEWGYIDYSKFNKNLSSHFGNFTEFKTRKRFTGIYAISTLEHMTKKTRQETIKKASELMKKSGGVFLATVDVQKGTDLIWNKSYGQVIEKNHGTIDDLFQELEGYFTEIDFRVQYNIRGVATDLLYITAK